MSKLFQLVGISIATFIFMLVFGMFVGAPIAMHIFELTIFTEVQALFVLMPFVYFFASLPLCFLVGYCFKYVAIKGSKALNATYVFVSSLVVTCLFYGIGVSAYYG